MFPLFLGFFGSSFFQNLLTSSSDSSSNKTYSSHVVSDGLLNVKFGIEENMNLKTVAYQDTVGVWTIGIGLVNIFDDNLNFVLKVYKGLTLSSLKAKMNKTHLSDLQFCFSLMRNHVRKSKSYTVFKDLDSNSIPYNSNLADAIVDFYYNSGSAYGTTQYYAFLQRLKTNKAMGKNLPLDFAIAYINYRLDYLASFSSIIYGSWLRRCQIFADRIANNSDMDNKKSWALYPTSKTVQTYIFSKYFYSLKKKLA